MLKTFLPRARQLLPKLIELRRTIYRNPELSFREFQTAALVAGRLQSMGIRHQVQVGKTGVVGHIGNEGPIVALRVDMDALPIQELNEVEYASQVPDVMHACGHDVHTACLLGAAHASTRDRRERASPTPFPAFGGGHGCRGEERRNADDR